MSFIYLPELFLAEWQVAERLAELLGNKCEEIPHSTEGLVHNQPSAVVNACRRNLSIITGCAGTGKTTTLRSIINSFEEAQLSGVICCPTGKAAKRAYQVVNSGRDVPVTCSTAHRMLGYNPMRGKFNFSENNPLEMDYVIIDEFPMCDLQLFNSILAAINPNRTRLILCGDPFQLPSISPGNVARDIISANVFPITKLNKIIRQGENSGIVYNSHRILKGEKLTETDEAGVKFKDFFIVYSEDDAQSHEKILFYATSALRDKRGIEPSEVQIIAPGKQGNVGVESLNKAMRNKLNPRGREQYNFRLGDRVLITKNDYRKNVVNGDTGYISELNQKGIEVDVDGGNKTLFSPDDIGQLQLAYAFTIHKSQGSEFRAVIYPVHKCHWILHSRNILYTGITRGKELVVLIGDKKSIAISIKNNKPINRTTGLKTRILQECAKIKLDTTKGVTA